MKYLRRVSILSEFSELSFVVTPSTEMQNLGYILDHRMMKKRMIEKRTLW